MPGEYTSKLFTAVYRPLGSTSMLEPEASGCACALGPGRASRGALGALTLAALGLIVARKRKAKSRDFERAAPQYRAVPRRGAHDAHGFSDDVEDKLALPRRFPRNEHT